VTFSSFKSHIDLAHRYWQHIVQPGDIVVDATCGNGQDTLFLDGLQPSRLYALDIQEDALVNTRTLLGDSKSVTYHLGCHSQFPEEIQSKSVKLIVYNLGYLPGGDKTLTTLSETTLLSVKRALDLVKPGGAISVTCYPGHPAGAVEENAILAWAEGLDRHTWSCCHHRWCNRAKAPSLLLIQSCKS
jgi:hypothetical protein